MADRKTRKPIIATTLSGLFIQSEPWKVAHILWFSEMAERLKDPAVKDYAHQANYFPYVDGVMKRLFPHLNDAKRTIKARELFFESVCSYVKQNLQLVNNDVVKYFEGLKSKYRIALITTNSDAAVARILDAANLQGFFDIVEASLLSEKDDKRVVFERFIKKHGKPALYVGGDRKDSFVYCQEQGISCVFANFEKQEDIVGVECFHGLEELVDRINAIFYK
jgi:phosphoglycolate phosphatase-like HAD superfamily hydrolase